MCGARSPQRRRARIRSQVRFVSSGLDFEDTIGPSTNGRQEILFCSDDAAVVNGLADLVGVALNASNPRSLIDDPLGAEGGLLLPSHGRRDENSFCQSMVDGMEQIAGHA